MNPLERKATLRRQDSPVLEYLTIIPRARMGSESIAHEAFSKIQQIRQKKYRDKNIFC